MKKISSRVKASIIILIILLAFGGFKIYGEFRVSENAQTGLGSDDETLSNALSTVIKNNDDKSAVSRDLVKFMEWTKIYNPTSEALQVVTGLINSGADIDALIEVCIFWEDTDQPFSLIEQIYNKAPFDELETIENHTIWIENVYNVIMNKENESLTVEDVKEYMKNGISTDDILIANRMSRKGDNNINSILEQKKHGKSWYELIVADDEPLSSYNNYNSLGGNDLLDAVIISKNNDTPLENLLQNISSTEDGTLLATLKCEKNIEAKQELVNMKLLPADFIK